MNPADRDQRSTSHQDTASFSPASTWQLPSRELSFGKAPLLMGIVNVTPDSFSDGGKFSSADAACRHARQLVADGADIIDIGGESTRPYADIVESDEEIKRVVPVIEQLAGDIDVPISIDTTKTAVAKAALSAGAEIINDVSGFRDQGMLALAVESNAAVCAMHMQGTPQTMQDHPQYDDVVEEIYDYLDQRKQQLLGAGIKPERICLDPGIGFGKTHEHNLTLLANCQRFVELEMPILVGHSRKGFIGKVLGDKSADRMIGTVAIALSLAQKGIQIIRVHDVLEVRQGLQLFEAAGGLVPSP